MPQSWTPSIVPNGTDQTVYIVLEDFGRLGRAYRETDEDRADLETVISDLLSGQYSNPFASSPSTQPSDGPRTHRRTWPGKSCAASTLPVMNCRRRLRLSPNGIWGRNDS